MKKIILSMVMACATCGVMAQSLTSYYMPDAIERRNHNIAFAPERGYFAIPLIGSTTLGFNGNLSVSSLIYQKNGELVTLLDSSVSASEALGNLKKGANFAAIESRFELFNFGAYCKDKSSFWSANIGLRTNASVSLPYELFEFMKLGKESNISDINMYMESFVDIGVGYSMRLLDNKLTVGGRAKVLVGLASANLNISKFDVNMNDEQWSVEAAGELDIYGPGFTNDGIVGEEFDFDDVAMDGFKPAGLGFAVDLGAEYQVMDRLKVSFAVNDLGFIKWNETCNAAATIDMEPISFTGVDIYGDGTILEPDFDFDDVSLNNAESRSTTRFMQASINMGGEYSFLDELLNVGVLYNIRLWEAKTMHNFILSGNVRPKDWFTFGASYGMTNGSNVLGLAVNFSPSWFNLYLASDFLLCKKTAQYLPINQSAMNLSLGMAIPIGQRSLRSKYTKAEE